MLRRLALVAALLSLAAFLSGCDRGPSAEAGGGARIKEQWPSNEPAFDGLTLDLSTRPGDDELDVAVKVEGPRAAQIKALVMAKRWADTRAPEAIHDLRVRDGDGDVVLEPARDDEGPDRHLELAHPPAGERLLLRYSAKANQSGSRFALRASQDRLTAVGHSFLVLPEMAGSFPVRVRWKLGGMRRGSEGGSSLGAGNEVAGQASTEELAEGVYAAGRLWVEGGAGDTPGLIVLGNPAFDTRTALRLATATDAAERKAFGEPGDAGRAAPLTLFFAGEQGLGQLVDGAFLGRAVALWFDASRSFDAEVKVLVAHELIHRHVGSKVRLADGTGRDASWFSEGFTVHLARELSLSAGTITPAEFLADAAKALGDADPSAPGEGRGVEAPEAYRRGALLAAALDGAVRRRSGNARTLADVVRSLLARAKGARDGRLPASALREEIEKEAGDGAALDLDRWLARPDERIDLPDDAFGPCFERRRGVHRFIDLGFDRAGLHSSPPRVRGLVRGSAAERAGLAEGEVITSSRLPDAAAALDERSGSRGEVELSVTTRGKSRKVRYRPVGSREGVSWEVKACPARP